MVEARAPWQHSAAEPRPRAASPTSSGSASAPPTPPVPSTPRPSSVSARPRMVPSDPSKPRDLRALPKAHLHLHFTGSMRTATLVELARVQGVRLPQTLLEGKGLRVESGPRGWFRFQRLYDVARSVVRSEAVMRRVLHEAAEDDVREGSVRLEIQIDPTSYAPFVGGITPAMEIVLDEVARIERELPISIGVIVAASRMRHPLDARTLARLAVRCAPHVVGFGLSNDERRGSTPDFGPAFRIAHDGGLAALPHGGELLGPEHVREVLDHLRPARLGHGVRAVEDPRLLEEIAERGIGLEVCPASNVSLGVFEEAGAVPLGALVDAGAQVALGADDPLLFGSRLLAQYEGARAQGMSDGTLAHLAASSIKASLLSEAEKAKFLGDIAAWAAN